MQEQQHKQGVTKTGRSYIFKPPKLNVHILHYVIID